MKTDGAAIMLQFECCKCEHVRDLWSSGSRELTEIEQEKVANGEMKASTREAGLASSTTTCTQRLTGPMWVPML